MIVARAQSIDRPHHLKSHITRNLMANILDKIASETIDTANPTANEKKNRIIRDKFVDIRIFL